LGYLELTLTQPTKLKFSEYLGMRLQLKYLLSTRNWPSYPATAIAGILFSRRSLPPS